MENADQSATVDRSEPRRSQWRLMLKRGRDAIVRRVSSPDWWRYFRKRWTDRCLVLYVELTGNKVKVQGLTFSVDNPSILKFVKSMMYLEEYESEEIKLLKDQIDPSLPAVEFGASIGVVSCLTNRKLRDPTRHVVVEANPLLIPTLERNRALNNAQFEILQMALGYGSEVIEFHIDEKDSLAGSLRGGAGQVISAPTTSLARIVNERGFQAINLVVDIEGAEVELVANELDALRRHVKHLLVETHQRFLPEGSIDAMLDALIEAGFEITAGDRTDDYVFALANRNL